MLFYIYYILVCGVITFILHENLSSESMILIVLYLINILEIIYFQNYRMAVCTAGMLPNTGHQKDPNGTRCFFSNGYA